MSTPTARLRQPDRPVPRLGTATVPQPAEQGRAGPRSGYGDHALVAIVCARAWVAGERVHDCICARLRSGAYSASICVEPLRRIWPRTPRAHIV